MENPYTIKIDKASRERMGELEKSLKSLGVKVEKSLKAIGVISGNMEDALQEKVRELRGVVEVRKSKSFSISPPDSRTQ